MILTMKLKKTILMLVTMTLVLLTSQGVSAGPVDTYEFSDPVTQKRYLALTKELRCPKCQNQNLAGSNSPIAQDLRQQVYTLLNEGNSDIEIMHYMVARYGEFVLYRPGVNSLTYLLWFGPAFLLLLGVIVVVFILRKKSTKIEQQALSQQQQDALKNILKDSDNK
jgi:cytochrome c-type biogenesis protein CcmH